MGHLRSIILIVLRRTFRERAFITFAMLVVLVLPCPWQRGLDNISDFFPVKTDLFVVLTVTCPRIVSWKARTPAINPVII